MNQGTNEAMFRLVQARTLGIAYPRVQKSDRPSSANCARPQRLTPSVRVRISSDSSSTFPRCSGGAFSLGQSAPWLFVGATLTVSVAIAATAFRHTSVLTSVALGLVLGGALGNLTDRALRGPHLSGHVVDFVDLHVWPVFNVADSAIVVGAIVLALSSVLADRRAPSADAG